MNTSNHFRSDLRDDPEAVQVLEILHTFCLDLNSKIHLPIEDLRLAVHALQLILLDSPGMAKSVESGILRARSAIEALEREPSDDTLCAARLSGAIEEIQAILNGESKQPSEPTPHSVEVPVHPSSASSIILALRKARVKK